MMKKLTALLLAATMLLCLTGCGQATEESVGGAVTFDELTHTLGYAVQQEEQAAEELSLPVTFKLDNSPELLDFMTAVNEGRATTYTNTLNEYGVGGVLEEVTYTIDFDGQSAYIIRKAGDEVSAPMAIAQFGMGELAKACVNMLGGFDQALFEQMIHALELDYPGSEEVLDRALDSVFRQPLQYKDFLCCGNSAMAEFLLIAGRQLQRDDLIQEARTRMAMVISRAERNGHYSCISRSMDYVFSATLFYGTAGIGYEMLRLIDPQGLDSLLL